MTERFTAEIGWQEVWADVALQMAHHRAGGRRHLVTEDTVRMCTILALERAGVATSRMAIEVLDPVLAGGKLDLSIEGSSGRTVVELKYPRASGTGISPDTMTMGELLRDFLRVALVQASDRWVVAVLEPELRRYLSRREALGWAGEVGRRLTLGRDLLEALPKTTLEAIGSLPWLLPVTATCEVARPIDVDLALFAYRVDAAEPGSDPAVLVQRQAPSSAPVSLRRRSRSGTARTEILAAIKDITTKSGSRDVTIEQVTYELRRRGSSYAESTISTMMSSQLCAQSQGPGIDPYADLDRAGRGVYRLREPEGERES